MGGGELGGEGGGLGPFSSPFQKTEFELHHAAIRGHGRGEMLQFIQSIVYHAQVGVTHSTFGTPEIFAELKQPAHAESYHNSREI